MLFSYFFQVLASVLPDSKVAIVRFLVREVATALGVLTGAIVNMQMLMDVTL